MADPVDPFSYAEQFNPSKRRTQPLAQDRAPVDPITAEIRRQRDRDLTLDIQLSPTPDAMARATRVAREAGVPPSLIEDRLDEAERGQNAQKLTRVLNDHPAIGQWAAANPRAAITAQDDYQSLGILGTAWDYVKKAPSSLYAGVLGAGTMAQSHMSMVNEGVESLTYPIRGALATVGRATGLFNYDPDVEDRQMAAARARLRAGFNANTQAARPVYGSPTQQAILQGMETLPLTVMAVATRNPRMGAGSLGALVGSESYQEAREQGKGGADSLRYGITQGSIEAATELAPTSRLLSIIADRVPVGKALTNYLAAEMPGELASTLLQSFNEWQVLNPEKSAAEWTAALPGELRDTALGVLGGGTATIVATKTAQRAHDVAGKVVRRVEQVQQARRDGETLDRIGKALDASKTRARDPEAVKSLLAHLGAENGTDHVLLSGEVVQAYMQSDAYDQYDGEFNAYQDAVSEAAATGGDVVLPIAALADLHGTSAWTALKDDMRLTAGGMSPREAQTFADSMDDVMADLSDRMDQTERETKAQRTAIEKLTDSIAEKLQNAGQTPNVARQHAELMAQRATVRAERLGLDLTGDEFDGTEIRQVLPPALAAARKADGTDLVINAMRKGKPGAKQSGFSLAQWIAKRGGVNDTGGDLASMGLDQWHKGKPGQRKLLRAFDPSLSLGGISGEGDYGVDSTLRAAIEAGYFPELAGVENEAGASTLDTQALYDALSDEMAGRGRYAEDAKSDDMRAAATELREMLSERGLDPDALTDAELRAEIEALQESEGGGFEQSFEDGPRGRITFPATGYSTGPTIIELFQSRNLSTALHEFGHQWLEELRYDATSDVATDPIEQDWQAVQDWFAANGHPIADGVIPVEAHELWARGVERYLMEGKAPTSALSRLFETFRGWLISIYKTVDKLRAPITPEIREVMDRLIATDDEIQAAAEQQALSPLFTDPAAAGMSGPEFDAYAAQVSQARGAAQGALLDKTMAMIRRRETKRWRDAREGVETEVTEQVDARPLFRALRLLKGEPVNRQWLVDEFGEDALSLLPKRVPPIYRDNGAHPTGVAELAGYGSGREMIEALIGAEIAHRQIVEGGDQRSLRARTIATETDARMNERYGDVLNDGSIEREALAAVHNEMQGEVIASEIRILSRSTGQRPTPYSLAKAWARGRVRQGVYATEAAPAAIQRHARAAAKAGREAEVAMLAGDTEEALRFKQQQMLSSALLSEAKAVNDEVQAAVKRMGKIAKQQTSKSIDQEYLEQAHALLEAVDLRQRTQKSITRQGKWAEWAAAREAEGFDIVVPASFEATLGLTNWTRLPTETLLGLDDAVKQVIHLGRHKQTLLDNQDRREFDAVVQEAVNGAGGLDQKPPRDLMEPGWADRFKSGVAAVDAGLLKMETVFDWLDGGDSNGVFNRVAFRPVADAQAREQDMLVDYYGRIRALFEALPAPALRRWSDTVTMPFANRETGLPERISRKQLVAVALNTGNEGNLQRLSDGYGWNAGALTEYLNDELSADEWTIVQGIWDTIDTLWPEIERLEKSVNGIAPDKVEARSFETPHGAMRGGYYPVIYDTSRDLVSEERAGREGDLFESLYTRATTRASATKARAEKVQRPVLLDLGVINRHLGEVIHDITHREAVMQANRFLTDHRVAGAVEQALGMPVRQQLRPWVKFVANSWAMERAGNEGIGKFFGNLRANATAVGMGFRLTTAVTQIAGYANSIEVVGERWVAEGIARFSAKPLESFNFVMEHSGEVRHRMDTLDRDIRTAVNQARGLGKLGEVKRFMFHGIGYMDRVVVIPTWIGAYNKALAGGMAEEDAVYAADKAVRASQGSGSPKDMAAIQRGTGKWGELLKAMTMFYSYFSAFYQRQRTLGRDAMGRDVRKPRDLPRLLARSWWLLVVPALLPDMIKLAVTGSGGPDDDEAWTAWAFKKFLSNSLGPIPFARDLIEPIWDKAAGNKSFGYSMSPLQRIGETFVNVGGDAGRIARGDDTKHATKNAMEAVGYATGLVPGQIASATQFLVDVGQGDADPQGFSDWMEGLSTGRLKDD